MTGLAAATIQAAKKEAGILGCPQRHGKPGFTDCGKRPGNR